MRRPGGLVLLLAFIGYSKCQVSIEGDCRYACDQDGSCKTDWNGSFRPGGTSASCFSPQFGGSCFGKVDGCKDCNQVCVGGSSGGSSSSSGSRPSGGSSGGLRDCEIKGLCTCQITSRGKECVGIPQENFPSGGSSSCGGRPCRPEDVPLENCERQQTCRCDTQCKPGQGCAKQCVGIPQENLPSGGRPSGGSSSSGGSKSDSNCRYQCQSNGGCQVFSSSGSGSCFSQSFGGSCSGTPRGCQDCNKAINC